jgi:hypothetical protein
MGEKRDFFFTPKEYLRFGDRPIKSPPLINTSLQELADLGWYLSVYATWIPGYGSTKIKYHFSDPDKNGYPFLVFRLWHPGKIMPALISSRDEQHVKSLEYIKILVERDLTPNFTKPPSFSLIQKVEYVPPMGNQEPVKIESELEMITKWNDERAFSLRSRQKPKGLTDEGWSYLQTGTI